MGRTPQNYCFKMGYFQGQRSVVYRIYQACSFLYTLNKDKNKIKNLFYVPGGKFVRKAQALAPGYYVKEFLMETAFALIILTFIRLIVPFGLLIVLGTLVQNHQTLRP